MYRRDLENALSRGNLPKSLLLHGLCDFQISHFGKAVLNQWNTAKDDPLVFYFDAYDFHSAKSHISQSSLFGDKNLLVIKTDKPLPKQELETLLALCHKDANSFLLLECYSDDAKVKTMAKSFSKALSSDVVRFFKPSLSEAMGFMTQIAKAKNLSIQSYALNHLYLTHNEDLNLAISEFDKLAILEREVTKTDIDRLVYGAGTVGVEEFASKLLDLKPIQTDYQSFVESGAFDEVRVLNALQNHVVQLSTFHLYIKLHGDFDAKEILGYPLPPHLAKERASQSLRFPLPLYQALLEALAQAEHTLKTKTHYDKPAFLLSTLLHVQSLIKKLGKS
ncbi:DNA polymerase III subunit delta [Sulfurospirillum sp. T05]|uniref:DNA polymerase III subunit delta n=1 Tax=Sulfurospirillum tamanense TaxID=2813362 RepID=A0ABS2WQA0_9BACT|nr:DNA polymerase III subunit delta [Sulfurospirillum tamanensis]MBN2963802.1 DNA polymerase III subunit delta [Sulfurospirillum tamanensis]